MKKDKFESNLLRGSLGLIELSVRPTVSNTGYAIPKSVQAASRKQVTPLYPQLHRLEADKLIKSKRDNSRGRKQKRYTLGERSGPSRWERRVRERNFIPLLYPRIDSSTNPIASDTGAVNTPASLFSKAFFHNR